MIHQLACHLWREECARRGARRPEPREFKEQGLALVAEYEALAIDAIQFMNPTGYEQHHLERRAANGAATGGMSRLRRQEDAIRWGYHPDHVARFVATLRPQSPGHDYDMEIPF